MNLFNRIRLILAITLTLNTPLLAQDKDNDTILDQDDNCESYYNPLQEDGDNNGIGDACDDVIKYLMKPKLFKTNEDLDVLFIENPFSIPFNEGDRSGFSLADAFPPFDRHLMIHDINSDGLLDIIASSNRITDENRNKIELGHASVPIYFINKGNLSFEVYKNPNYIDYSFFHAIQNYDFKDLNGDDAPDFHLGGEHYHLGLSDSVSNQNLYNWLERYADHKRFEDYSQWEFKKLRYYTINEDGLLIDNFGKISVDEMYPSVIFASIHSIATGDIDNDGDNDMINFAQYDQSQTPFNFDYAFAVMKNDGSGNFSRELFTTNFFCGEGRFILFDTDADSYDEVIGICNDNRRSSSNPKISALYEFDNIEGEIDFENPTKIENIYDQTFNQPDRTVRKTLRAYHIEDLNNDGVDELILLVTGMYSGLGNLPFNTEALSNLLPHNQIKIYNIIDNEWTDVTQVFLPNDYNYDTWYANHMSMSFGDIDGNGTTEMIPFTAILNPEYMWNNTTNFQFFTYNKLTNVFDYVSLPSYSEMFPNNHLYRLLKQNNFELADLDNDGIAEVIKSSSWHFSLDGGESKNYLIILKEKNLRERITRQTVSINQHNTIPQSYSLSQNYPNPFNPSTTIRYALTEATQVRVEVFSLLGQSVGVLLDGFQQAGNHSVNFDASNLTTGVYFYRLVTPKYTETRQMMLIK